MPSDLSVEFPPFRLDLANHELWRGSSRLSLRPKPFAVLAYLATHPRRLVLRDELVQAVWPDTHVGEGLLRGYVREVRVVLGDDPEAPRFIETVARRGYRFVAAVRRSDEPIDEHPVDQARPTLPPGNVVGREAELDALDRRLADAVAGARQVVFVTGEPGIGKTTLVDTFVARVAARGVWATRGQCVEHFGVGEAYLPVLEALANLCRSSRREQVCGVLARHAPMWLAQMPALMTDAELEAVQRRVQGATTERMLRELAEAIEVLTATEPLVLVLEDLQWSDHSTLDLLSSLARRRTPARLLLLGTYRPADVARDVHPMAAIAHELHLHGQCAELALHPLTASEVDHYLTRRFSHELFPSGLGRSIHHATEGNPLFVVNVVDDWIARAVLVQDGERWTIDARLADVATVPDTLRQMIERQLDRLPSASRRLLEAASVVGAEFSTAAVAALLEDGQEAVDEACEAFAERGQLLRACGVEALAGDAVTGRYEFVHALYPQVLYERILPARRVRLHRRVGEWAEAAYGARVQEHAAKLAVHYERGHDHRRAVRHLESAATNATTKHAYREAIVLLGRALELLAALPDTPERTREELSLRMALGTALLMTKGYGATDVEQSFARAHALSGRMDDTPELAFVLAGLFRFFFVRSRFDTARELGEQVLRLAANEPSLLAVAHSLIGLPLLATGNFVAARNHLAQGVALYDFDLHGRIAPRHGDDPGLTALAFLAIAEWFLGYPDRALERSRQGIALAERLAMPFSVAFATIFAAWAHVRRGEASSALARSEAVIALATEQGFGFLLAEACVFRGWALAEQGNVESGIEQMHRGLDLHRSSGSRTGGTSHLTLLAEAYGKAKRPEDGLRVVQEGLAALAETGERSSEAELYRVQGELLHQIAKRSRRNTAMQDKAEASIRRALAIAREQGSKSLELRAVLALCRVRATPSDRELLGELHGWFTEGFDTADLKAARALLDAARVMP